MPVIYHGSIREAHGPGVLVATDGNRYHLRVACGDLFRVRRESFTIVDDDPENAALAEQFKQVSA